MNRIERELSALSPLPTGLSGRPAAQRDLEARDASGVRWDRIRRLRAEIAAGTYATPERWERALTGLVTDL